MLREDDICIVKRKVDQVVAVKGHVISSLLSRNFDTILVKHEMLIKSFNWLPTRKQQPRSPWCSTCCGGKSSRGGWIPSRQSWCTSQQWRCPWRQAPTPPTAGTGWSCPCWRSWSPWTWRHSWSWWWWWSTIRREARWQTKQKDVWK